MKIIVDQNIPLANETFGHYGEVIAYPGREITANDVADADALIVRSITKVNQALLQDSSIKFLGTCTIGIDHLDIDYLNKAGVTWASAPGCNANAVVQYVLSAMASVRPEWQSLTIGIVGHGQIGSRLYRLLTSIGVNCKVYDPFVEPLNTDDFVSFDELLTHSDVITCHVPLTNSGPFPTYHLMNDVNAKMLKENAMLINSSRGGVIDELAVLSVKKEKNLSVVLDVWENEPQLDTSILNQTTLATPHIAGYTLEGKEAGTLMIFDQFCQFFKLNTEDAGRLKSSSKQNFYFSETAVEKNIEQQLNDFLLGVYPIKNDDAKLRAYTQSELSMPEYFDQLRKQYPVRREYTNFQIERNVYDKKLESILTKLGVMFAEL